jgi:hypothetical protein
MSNNRERIKSFLVLVATFGVIFINFLAGTGRINQTTPAEISDKYPTLITPAGYAFSIWSLIYLGLIVFSIYQILPKNHEKFRPIRSAYILSCAANCAWIYFWHHDLPVLCVGIILLLLGSLAFINLKLTETATFADYWFAKFPFGLYFGWVTAATILNSAIALVSLNVQFPESAAKISAAALLFVTATLGVLVSLKLKNYSYPLAIAWALTAIAIKNAEQTLIVASAAVGVGACLIAALSFVMNQKSAKI